MSAAKCSPKCRELAQPESYDAWHEWAEEKSRTHGQRQCPGCGLWTIWVRKRRAAVPDPGEASGR